MNIKQRDLLPRMSLPDEGSAYPILRRSIRGWRWHPGRCLSPVHSGPGTGTARCPEAPSLRLVHMHHAAGWYASQCVDIKPICVQYFARKKVYKKTWNHPQGGSVCLPLSTRCSVQLMQICCILCTSKVYKKKMKPSTGGSVFLSLSTSVQLMQIIQKIRLILYESLY